MSEQITKIRDLKAYVKRIIDGVKTLDDVNYVIKVALQLAPEKTVVSKSDAIAFFEQFLEAIEKLDDEYLVTSLFSFSQEDVNGTKLAALLNNKDEEAK